MSNDPRPVQARFESALAGAEARMSNLAFAIKNLADSFADFSDAFAIASGTPEAKSAHDKMVSAISHARNPYMDLF